MTSLCDICGRPAENTCTNCGKRVCARHYDAENGVCTQCSKPQGGKRGEFAIPDAARPTRITPRMVKK